MDLHALGLRADSPNVSLIALWWARGTPSLEQLDSLCRSAPVVSLRAVAQFLPTSCEGTLVLHGIGHARGGAVELWRDDPPRAPYWCAVWTADVGGDRPWTPLVAAVSDSDG